MPDYLENIYIRMPLVDFENIKDTSLSNISENVLDMWFEIDEDVSYDGIDNIVYKFDRVEEDVNIERPLYQINIKFFELDTEEDYVN